MSDDPIFDAALAKVLRFEGGFVDDPADRGGATCHGITQTTYDIYSGGGKDVKDITDAEVRSIYRQRYWMAGRCDLIAQRSPALALVHFDSGVLCGLTQAAKFLQRAVGVVADGWVGSATLGALDAKLQMENEASVLRKYLDERRAFHEADVAAHPLQQRFLAGWLARVDALGEQPSLA